MIATFEVDTLVVRVAVTNQATGLPLDLTGAAIVVIAERSGAGAIVGTAAVIDATGGILQASFAPDVLTEATYSLQVQVTVGGATQTVVATTITAARSLRAP